MSKPTEPVIPFALTPVLGRACRVGIWLVLVFCLVSPKNLYAQTRKQPAPAAEDGALEEDAQREDYSREFNYGVNFNTNGGLIGGGILKYAWLRPNGQYYRIGLEVVHIKHPKEARARGALSSFIPYKYNYLYTVRPSFGIERVLFRKAPEEGVQLNLIVAGGPSLGFVKPYYVLYTDNANDPTYAYSTPYDPSMKPNQIVGVGRVFDGFNKLSIVPGIHAKVGLSFESGRIRSSVFGLEAGFISEFYAKKITLLKAPNTGVDGYISPNQFHGLYLIVYYGNKY